MKRFIRRLRRLIAFIPVIWRTNDWDYGYSLELLQFSLGRLAKEVENGYGVNGKHQASRMRLVNRLIENELSLKYLEEWYDADGKTPVETVYKKEAKNWKLIWRIIEQDMQTWWD